MADTKPKKGVASVEEQIAMVNVRIGHLQLVVEKMQHDVSVLVCKDKERLARLSPKTRRL